MPNLVILNEMKNHFVAVLGRALALMRAGRLLTLLRTQVSDSSPSAQNDKGW